MTEEDLSWAEVSAKTTPEQRARAMQGEMLRVDEEHGALWLTTMRELVGHLSLIHI